jgi:hypothetical protein
MSRAKVNQLLAERGYILKDAETYVAVVEGAQLDARHLPPGCDGLGAWLALAREVLGRAIRGIRPEPSPASHGA